jgi:hypothetical protein
LSKARYERWKTFVTGLSIFLYGEILDREDKYRSTVSRLLRWKSFQTKQPAASSALSGAEICLKGVTPDKNIRG